MFSLLRTSFVLLMFFVVACTGNVDTSTPAFYENLTVPGTKVNAAAAASMISDYRKNHALGGLELDPTLMRVAEDHAAAMAKADKVTHDLGGKDLKKRMQIASYRPLVAAENVGAGYQTLAEAFSGWRDSPSHNKNMLIPAVTKMGIGAVFVPKSKYKVYWALVLAEPDPKAY
jgi:uncharacterized protein YkwD